MRHRNLHGVVAIGNSGRRQTIAFGSQDKCQLFGACDMLILKCDGIVFQRQGRNGESEPVQ